MKTWLWVLKLFFFLLPFGSEASNLPDFVVPTGLGVASHFHALPAKKDLVLLQQAGIHIVRTCVTWEKVEREKGVYNFENYVHLADALRKQGIRPIFILAYGNPLYDASDKPFHEGPGSTEVRTAFARFAGAAAAAFRDRDVIWEIWNEPNINPFWRPKRDPVAYVNLVKEASQAIRKEDLNAFIVGPSLAGGHKQALSYLGRCFKLGLLEFVDAVSVHPYRKVMPESVVAYYSEIRRAIEIYAPLNKKEIPIIVSEWGYSVTNHSFQEQADYLVRSYLVNLSCGVPITVWYDWRDDGENPKNREHNFGLLRFNYSEKLSYSKLVEMTRELRGYHYKKRVQGESDDDWVLLFSNGKKNKVVLWTTGKPHRFFTDSVELAPDKIFYLSASPMYWDMN